LNKSKPAFEQLLEKNSKKNNNFNDTNYDEFIYDFDLKNPKNKIIEFKNE